MNIVAFLDHCNTPQFLGTTSCVYFKGTEYPVLFFSALYSRIQTINGSSVSLDLSEYDLASIKARLEMSFLGSSTVYWLRNLGQLNDKERAKFLAYMRTYQGPNVVLFFINVDEDFTCQHSLAVELPATVDKKLFLQLAEREYAGSSASYVSFANALFAKTDHLSLDTSYALFRYVRLLGTSQADFMQSWLDSIVTTEKSLFTLSQHFFAKDSAKFFATWQQLHQEYVDVFWVTFWSEQLWRAHNFIRLMQEKQFAQAKAIAYRLPFSFIQRDWKKTSLAELQRAHAFVYQIDHKLKNGAGVCSLDLLYSKFLLGTFSTQL